MYQLNDTTEFAHAFDSYLKCLFSKSIKQNSGNPTDVMSRLHCGGSVREFRNSAWLTSVGAPRISDVCRDPNRNQES